jgi:hypothetical protein
VKRLIMIIMTMAALTLVAPAAHAEDCYTIPGGTECLSPEVRDYVTDLRAHNAVLMAENHQLRQGMWALADEKQAALRDLSLARQEVEVAVEWIDYQARRIERLQDRVQHWRHLYFGVI